MDRWGWQQLAPWLDLRTIIQRQLGHANLGITSIYLQGIDNSEIISTVFARPAPMLPASAGLR
jgi:integrase/recombinase XerD